MVSPKMLKGIGCYSSSFIHNFLIPQLQKHNIHIIKDTSSNSEYRKESYHFGIFDHTYSFEKIKNITKIHNTIPWFLLSYTKKSRNHYNALDYGIDVIIALPCKVEHIARIIRNVAEKTLNKQAIEPALKFYENNQLKIKLIQDNQACFLTYYKQVIPLTPLEGKIVKLIVKRLNQKIYFLDYETLFHYLKVKQSTLKTAISLLRKKFKEAGVPLAIKNEYAIGYRLVTYT